MGQPDGIWSLAAGLPALVLKIELNPRSVAAKLQFCQAWVNRDAYPFLATTLTFIPR
ncbi:MAG: hypothetical protein GZ092_02125 [Polaromonas sp.]|nr:hypothetical protein [Polaromonas sp.]